MSTVRRHGRHGSRPLGGPVAFVVAAALTGVAGFVFHVMMSRALGPESYGALAALLTMLLVATVPLTGVELAVTAVVGRTAAEGSPPDLRALAFRSGLAGGWMTVAGMLLSAPIARLLHLESPDPVLLAAVYLGLATVAAPLRGVLLGRLRYAEAAMALVVMGSLKLGLGGWHLSIGGDLTRAMLVLVVAELAQVAVVVATTRPLRSPPGAGSGVRMRPSGLAHSTGAMVGLWLLTTGHVILAGNLFSGDGAGFYAAAATAAQALLFIPQVVFQAAFPLLVRAQGDDRRRRFVSAVALSLGVTGLAGVAMIAVPAPVAGLFGAEFLGAAPLLRYLIPASLAFGLVYGVVHAHLAAGNRSALTAWVGVGGLAVVAAIAPPSPGRLAWCVMVVAAGAAGWALSGVRRAWETEEAAVGLTSPPTREVTVVVPFFNPGPRVADTIRSIIDTFGSRRVDVEVVAVSDGSSDGSTRLVEDLVTADPRVRLLILPRNRGKGAALKAGMVRARGEWIGMLDADGDIPAEVLGSFFDLARGYAPDVVAGSKRHALSRIECSTGRRALSVGFELVTRILFRLGIGDTQTGVKLFHRRVLAAALAGASVTGYAFDVELLVAARAAGYRRIAAAPVIINRSFTTTVSFRSVMQVAWATAIIVTRLVAGRYRPSPPPLPSTLVVPARAPAPAGL